jgi:hypothetical protein
VTRDTQQAREWSQSQQHSKEIEMSLIDQGAGAKTIGRNEYVGRLVDRFVDRRKGFSSTYDSVVIAGNGIGAQVFAAQLAHHPRFEGKVAIVAPPMVENRRLINGVSLRGLAADFIGEALGVTHERLLRDIAGPGPLPVANRQTASMAYQKKGTWHFTRRGSWQGGARGGTKPVVYGIRNSRLVGGIRELLDERVVIFHNEKVESGEHLRSFAAGNNPLLVNATTNPNLLNKLSKKPDKMVLAVQVPLIVAATGTRAPAEPSTAFAPLIRRNGAIDVGYFTPFRDPLSPRASWYGIFARVVDADSGFDKDKELDVMTDELYGVSAAMGLIPDDPQETLPRALVPAAPWSNIAPSQPGTLDLKRMYSGGAPCFYADGMVSSAIGGVVGAEAVVHGHDPDKAIRRALRVLRRHNFLWWVETTQIAPAADLLMRINVRMAMAYPHSSGVNLWRSAA